jgi:hypothetical protein
MRGSSAARRSAMAAVASVLASSTTINSKASVILRAPARQ